MASDEEILKRVTARRALASLLAKNDADKTILGGVFGSLGPSTPPASPVVKALMQYSNPFAVPSSPRNTLASLIGGTPAVRPPAQTIWPTLPTAAEPVKRKVFFSFHYKDVFRANNVRQQGKIGKRPSTFYDWSLWERRKLQGSEALKRLIREGVHGASTVCVLIGSETYERPWVRYEIARAIVEQRGLLGIHINGINHIDTQRPDPLGLNPFEFMGIYKEANDRFRIYEKIAKFNRFTNQWEWSWEPFSEWTQLVPMPKYLVAPDIGYIRPLSTGVGVYDYCHPEKDMASWIDRAAIRAGR